MSGPTFGTLEAVPGRLVGMLLWPEQGIAEVVMSPDDYEAALRANRIKNGLLQSDGREWRVRITEPEPAE